MKSELQIAKENVNMENTEGSSEYWFRCIEHKASLKRFFCFLETWFKFDSMDDEKCTCKGCKFYEAQLNDVKEAIKFYDSHGISS